MSPIIKSAKKYLKVSKRKRGFNLRRLKTMRGLIKNLRNFIAQGKLKEAQNLLPQVFKAIDKATKRGVIKKNTAGRKKSRLTKTINRLSKNPKEKT